MPPAADLYATAFAARCDARRPPDQTAINQGGVLGLLPSLEHSATRLLVTDDTAFDVLSAVLAQARAGMITVFAGAVRCGELMQRLRAWRPQATTALVLRDLRTAPAVPLAGDLTLRAVRRRPGDAADGVRLEDAAAAAVRADPRIVEPPEAFVSYLRSLPATTRLLAAVDSDDVVRATSGCDVAGGLAGVMFVNTDPGWRGRGIGRAMTSAALRAAALEGARGACLDATDAGLPIYRRLGFELVARATRFSRSDDQAA